VEREEAEEEEEEEEDKEGPSAQYPITPADANTENQPPGTLLGRGEEEAEEKRRDGLRGTGFGKGS
jgi:hypothetical protein